MTPEEILTKKKVNFITKGKNLVLRCLNPHHEDKNPSMMVDKITGVFQCWSCGFKGNILNHFGLKTNALDIRRQRLKEKIMEKLSENIGLDIPENAVPFRQDWRNISVETYKHFEAFQHNEPQFAGRVVFPIRSPAKKIVAFIGRSLNSSEDKKYLIYPSKVSLPLFPTTVEPINGRIILVEGIFDMLNLWDKGLKNAICSFGTNTLLGKDSKGPARLELLKVLGVYGIDILFDSDDAGQKAAIAVKDLCENKLEFDTSIKKLESIKDPGELTAPQVLRLRELLYG